jgi:hypothetical protein
MLVRETYAATPSLNLEVYAKRYAFRAMGTKEYSLNRLASLEELAPESERQPAG